MKALFGSELHTILYVRFKSPVASQQYKARLRHRSSEGKNVTSGGSGFDDQVSRRLSSRIRWFETSRACAMCKVWNLLAVPRLRSDGAMGARVPFWEISAGAIAAVYVLCMHRLVCRRRSSTPCDPNKLMNGTNGICFGISIHCRQPWSLSPFICWTLVISATFIIRSFFATCPDLNCKSGTRVGPPPSSRRKRSGPQRSVADGLYHGRD